MNTSSHNNINLCIYTSTSTHQNPHTRILTPIPTQILTFTNANAQMYTHVCMPPPPLSHTLPPPPLFIRAYLQAVYAYFGFYNSLRFPPLHVCVSNVLDEAFCNLFLSRSRRLCTGQTPTPTPIPRPRRWLRLSQLQITLDTHLPTRISIQGTHHLPIHQMALDHRVRISLHSS